MSRCMDLDPELHDVLDAITRSGVTKRGHARTTPQRVAEALDLSRRDARLLLADLEADGLLEVGDDSAIRLLQGCTCNPAQIALDSQRGSVVRRAPGQAGPLGASSQGESGPPYGGTTPPPVRQKSRRDFESQGSSPEIPRKVRRTSPEPGKLVGKRGARRARPDPTSPYDLANHFARQVQRMKREFGMVWVGGVNVAAVRSQIARWVRDGDADPALVLAMIDEFTRSPGWIREGQPAWKSFLAARQALANHVVDTASKPDACAETDAWLGFEAASPTDASHWLEW